MSSKLMRKEDLIELLQKIPDGTLIATTDNTYGVGGVTKESSTQEKAYLYLSESQTEIITDYLPEVKDKPYAVVPVLVLRW